MLKLPKLPLRALAGTGVLLGGMVVSAEAQTPSLAMLDGLNKGAWQIRYRDSDHAIQRICLQTGRELIQLRHPRSDCSRYVVEDGTNQVTVQYTCRGNNYGRTSIRRESGVLVQVDSQGIAEGLPFQFNAEARRVGNCS